MPLMVAASGGEVDAPNVDGEYLVGSGNGGVAGFGSAFDPRKGTRLGPSAGVKTPVYPLGGELLECEFGG